MKTYPTCEKCRGSLHPVFDMPDKFWCPTCKRFYQRSSFGWMEVNA